MSKFAAAKKVFETALSGGTLVSTRAPIPEDSVTLASLGTDRILNWAHYFSREELFPMPTFMGLAGLKPDELAFEWWRTVRNLHPSDLATLDNELGKMTVNYGLVVKHFYANVKAAKGVDIAGKLDDQIDAHIKTAAKKIARAASAVGEKSEYQWTDLERAALKLVAEGRPKLTDFDRAFKALKDLKDAVDDFGREKSLVANIIPDFVKPLQVLRDDAYTAFLDFKHPDETLEDVGGPPRRSTERKKVKDLVASLKVALDAVKPYLEEIGKRSPSFAKNYAKYMSQVDDVVASLKVKTDDDA